MLRVPSLGVLLPFYPVGRRGNHVVAEPLGQEIVQARGNAQGDLLESTRLGGLKPCPSVQPSLVDGLAEKVAVIARRTVTETVNLLEGIP